MTPAIPSLVPLQFPLTGSHLIEASAGTGKTFTIALLYVRLILGHGGETAFAGGALTPPEILVVTFTDAATKELRDRIRTRLAEAARLFREDAASIDLPQNPDPLYALKGEYPPEAWPACARKLELAAEWMDEAAISTIHGWCNRMLREHAFDSRSLFTQHLETDQSELRAEVVRDYWRNFYYPLPLEEVRLAAACWKSPAALETAVLPLFDHIDRLPAAVEPASLLRQCVEERTATLARLKAPWVHWTAELRTLFDNAKAAGQLDGRKMRSDWYNNWLDRLEAWAKNPADDTLEIEAGWKRLTRSGIADAWKTIPPPDHPAFDAIPAIQSTLAALPDPQTGLLTHAARWIAAAFDAAQQRRAQIGFRDLLTGLDAALSGPRGDRLAEIIRQQFPVALIDEFQDTDPIQYRIFARVYALAENRPDCALILIGDPKQAIYAFRGADIHTYLRARTAVQGRLYTLDRNHRSTQAMVEAVNHCFAGVEDRPDSAGAFRFRHGEDNPVPFIQVTAKGRTDAFQVDGDTLPAMTLAVLAGNGPLSRTAYIEQMSGICATRIVRWLNLGARGQAGFTGPEGLRPVKPADIAILVNNGKEAAHIRRELARRGVRSVYLSDKDTVYATPQATEIHRWLTACAEPDDDRLLRAALSTPSLGLSLADLDALNADELRWETRVEQFKGFREVWHRQGVLPMLRRILTDFGCHDRLLNLSSDRYGQSGERILTDLLHLAELLQETSFTLEGEHALCRFLAEQIVAPEGEADGKKLRLESDADLVKVVTIHKSKGLEYPLVLLPFICATRLTREEDVPLKWHDEAGELHLALESAVDIVQQTDQERLGEDLRKLYVALTRARYLTWLGLAPLNKNEPSAISHVFGLPAEDAAPYAQTLRDFAAGASCLELVETLETDATPYQAPAAAGAAERACVPTRTAMERWRIGSFSSLRVEGHARPALPPMDDTPQTDNLLEGERELPAAVSNQRPGSLIHGFPRGAEPGAFLHELMEWVANTGFPNVLHKPVELRDMIARRCKVRGWEKWIDPLCEWVQQMLTRPLPVGAGLRLETLVIAKAEMEFWFAATQVDLARLDALVTRHTLGGRPRPHLTPESLNGMLKGFMDLVFEYEGRYYVADYKSNWLGPADQDYTAENMDHAIRQHRYDMQYVIYLFALHRLLKLRRPDYDYARDVGGAVYLFVRGIGAPTCGVHFERPPVALMDALDALFAGTTGEVA